MNGKYLFVLPIFMVFCSCHNDMLTEKYKTTILKNVVSNNMPEIHNDEEIKLIKNNKVKSISYIAYNFTRDETDSLTFVEYDMEGKVLRRTTKENFTQGCLPYMIRKEFIYEGNRIKKVNDYTFKYVAKSTLENWLLKDTTKLKLFDWEDYTYKGDTIIVESGFAIHTYVKDHEGNVIKRTVTTKTDKVTSTFEYEFNDESIVQESTSPSFDNTIITDYFFDKNIIKEKYNINNKDYLIEYMFDENGLLKSKSYYQDKNKKTQIIVSYTYY